MANFSKYNQIHQKHQENVLNKEAEKVVEAESLMSPPTTPEVSGAGLPRLVYFGADSSGCYWWRIGHMASHLSAYGKATTMTVYSMVHHPAFFTGVDCVILQRQISDVQVNYIEQLRKLSDNLKKSSGKGFKIIWEVDDVIAPADAIPHYNECRAGFTDPAIERNMTRVFKVIDEMTVPSQAMRQHYGTYFNYKNISVIPNYMSRPHHDRFYDIADRIKLYHKKIKKPTIMYSGSGTHYNLRTGQTDDFTHVIDDIYNTREEFDWVFVGGYPIRLRKLIESGTMRYIPWKPLFELPQVMHEVGAQVAIAPLADNIFNQSKANIKVTESNILGIPVVSQNLQCYRDNPWKFDTGSQMIQQIRNILKDKVTYEKACKDARAYAEDYFIDKHMDEALLIYTTDFYDPKRWENPYYTRHNVKMTDLPVVTLE